MKFFPFERVRKGQEEFMKDVANVLAEGKHLIAHAPTGIGKTAAAVVPSLSHALAEGKTVFFLTPKHTHHVMVVETLKLIKEKSGEDFIVVDIVGKQWTCPYKAYDLDTEEFNYFCKKRKKAERCEFYNRIRKKKAEFREVVKKIREEILHSEEVAKICEDYGFCSYEASVEAGKKADFIICDYFHLFSEKVREALLSKLGKRLQGSIMIIDEAHNLPDRIRKLLSYSLSENTIKKAAKEARLFDFLSLAEDLEELIKVISTLGKGLKEEENLNEKKLKAKDLVELIEERLKLDYLSLCQELRELSELVLELPDRTRAYSRGVSRFLEKWISEDFGYVRSIKREKGRFYLQYRCLDPSIISEKTFAEVSSSILMSGTMLPLEMYRDVLGFERDRVLLKAYRSPFPKENKLWLIVPNVTTKYSKRSEVMYKKYASLIAEISKVVPGNVAAFFPAYKVLDAVAFYLKKIGIEKELIIEKQEMKKEEKIQLRNRLELLLSGTGGILLGVQAGSLSEGVDYANNLLSCVIIVGLPLEIPNLYVKSLIDFYDIKFNRGWDYGYIFPAMNKALQAAGRCIRSESDRGVIVLMDERFRWRNYAKCLPSDERYIITENPEKYIKKFFTS